MSFAKRTFQIAAAYGLVVLIPMWFKKPPFITYLEFYYGFLGVAFAWQIAFLIIAQNPVKFKPFMIPAIIEKASFGLIVVIRHLNHGVKNDILLAGIIDLAFAYAFWLSFQKTK